MENITEAVALIAPAILVIWALITTVYGLYLSRKNNELYNKRIIELLESINDKVDNSIVPKNGLS